jgi:hypothetical protein
MLKHRSETIFFVLLFTLACKIIFMYLTDFESKCSRLSIQGLSHEEWTFWKTIVLFICFTYFYAKIENLFINRWLHGSWMFSTIILFNYTLIISIVEPSWLARSRSRTNWTFISIILSIYVVYFSINVDS